MLSAISSADAPVISALLGIYKPQNACFSPEREVSRGEFLTMLVKTLDIPAKEVWDTGYIPEAPLWLQPYLTAAARSGLTAGLPDQEVFGEDSAITGAEAAVMLQNALDLAVSETLAVEEDTPAWARNALAALTAAGMDLQANRALTRGEAAGLLYSCAQLAEEKLMM